MSDAVVLEDVVRTYRGKVPVPALRGVTLRVARGESVSIMGRSGSGKSTLLNVVGGIDRPDSGLITVGETVLGPLSEERLARFRRDHIGFVFQAFNLLAGLRAWENVALPMVLRGKGSSMVKRRACDMLDSVGLGDRVHAFPAELSGGEMQRVAIARALITDPEVVIADEPTGNLDSETADTVAEVLFQVVRGARGALILATHDRSLAKRADRTLRLVDGRILDTPMVL